MQIEKVRLRKTLKSGKKVWLKGTVLIRTEGRPIPSEIIREIRGGTHIVEILEGSGYSPELNTPTEKPVVADVFSSPIPKNPAALESAKKAQLEALLKQNEELEKKEGAAPETPELEQAAEQTETEEKEEPKVKAPKRIPKLKKAKKD